jgi:hypothetical protein
MVEMHPSFDSARRKDSRRRNPAWLEGAYWIGCWWDEDASMQLKLKRLCC